MFSFFKKKKPPEAEIVAEVKPEPSILPVESPLEPLIEVPVAVPPASVGVEVVQSTLVVESVLAVKDEHVDAFVPPSDLAQPQERPKLSWTERLKMGLAKTRDKLGKSLASVFGGGQIDEELYEELETVLLTADMGVDATQHLLKDVRERVSLKGLKDSGELKDALKSSLMDLIQPLEIPLDVSGHKPFILMVAGVNGAGKTTSIGKLAKYFQSQNLSVLLAAGDTFRAAAREQLVVWGERNGVQVIAQASGDAAAVAFDAVNAAKARGIDVVIVDTAGRLPTQLHLMEEIKKVKRVVQKADPTGPHEILLVLDANTGQNALAQVKSFDDALGLTGLVLTKLDGTAKGGIIAAIAKNRPVPLRFIGVGETIDDLRPFAAKDYIDALFE
ncbi:MAG: signal recognition particle-docking protein FtsY [Deefgea sp.]